MKLDVTEKFCRTLQVLSRENWTSCFLNAKEQLSFHLRKRENLIPSVFEARQYLRPLFLSFLFFGTLYRAVEELITGNEGRYHENGENSAEARGIDFVPNVESECAGSAETKVV